MNLEIIYHVISVLPIVTDCRDVPICSSILLVTPSSSVESRQDRSTCWWAWKCASLNSGPVLGWWAARGEPRLDRSSRFSGTVGSAQGSHQFHLVSFARQRVAKC